MLRKRLPQVGKRNLGKRVIKAWAYSQELSQRPQERQALRESSSWDTSGWF